MEDCITLIEMPNCFAADYVRDKCKGIASFGIGLLVYPDAKGFIEAYSLSNTWSKDHNSSAECAKAIKLLIAAGFEFYEEYPSTGEIWYSIG